MAHLIERMTRASNSAWFGQGDLLKRKAWDKAKQLIDAVRETSRLLTAVS